MKTSGLTAFLPVCFLELDSVQLCENVFTEGLLSTRNQMGHWLIGIDCYTKVPALKSLQTSRGDKQDTGSIMQMAGGQELKGRYDDNNIPVLNKRKPWF